MAGLILVKSSAGNGARDDFNQAAEGCVVSKVLSEKTGYTFWQDRPFAVSFWAA